LDKEGAGGGWTASVYQVHKVYQVYKVRRRRYAVLTPSPLGKAGMGLLVRQVRKEFRAERSDTGGDNYKLRMTNEK